MPLALILVGVLLVVVAYQNTMGQLWTALKTDVPGYFVWMIAIVALLGLGYVPALKTPSRWLLGLVVLVVILTNYSKILAGFQSFATTGAAATGTGATAADPATAFASSPAAPLPTAAQVAGDSGASSTGAGGAASSSAGGSADAGALAGAASSMASLASQPFGSIMGGAEDALTTAIGFGGFL